MTCANVPDGYIPMDTSELVKCMVEADVCIFQTDYFALDSAVKRQLKSANCINNSAYYDVYGVSYMLLVLLLLFLLCLTLDSWVMCELHSWSVLDFCSTLGRITLL